MLLKIAKADSSHKIIRIMKPEKAVANHPNRRNFFAGLAAGAAGLLPALTGLGVLLDPLRRKSQLGKAIRITSLAALPADGIPRKFSVLTDRSDAWNRFGKIPVGAVYLRRSNTNRIEALNVVCPHAGCFVEFQKKAGNYLCPCHNSRFDIDGSVSDPQSPSPRGLDSLQVELRGTEVWVRYQKFQAGKAEKRPVI